MDAIIHGIGWLCLVSWAAIFVLALVCICVSSAVVVSRFYLPKVVQVKTFNSFQAVVAFAAWPFAISWLSNHDAKWAGPASVVACICYVVAVGFMIAAVKAGLEKLDN